MKKIIALAITVALVVGLFGCTAAPTAGEAAGAAPAAEPAVSNETAPAAEAAPEEAAPEEASAETDLPKGEWVIGLSNSYYGNTWRKQMVNDFTEAADFAKSQGWIKDYEVQNGDSTVNAQIAQINSFILEGVDAICINAASPTALNSVLQKAIDAGIVVVSFDSNVVGLDGCYVCDYDMEEYGAIQARFFAEKLGGKGNLVWCRGISGTTPSTMNYDGSLAVLKDYPDVKIVGEVWGEASATVAQEEMLKLLPSLPQVDGVLTNGGGDSYGIVSAFEQYGENVPIVIGDNSAEFVHWWIDQKNANGYETMSLCCPPGCSSAAMYVALNILNGKEVPETCYLAMATIHQDEVDQYADLEAGTLVSHVFTNEEVVNSIIKPSLEAAGK